MNLEKISIQGLPNYGNTCYMNVVLQSLSHIYENYFISGNYYNKISNINDKQKIFLDNFAHLIASIENKNNKWTIYHTTLYLKNVIQYIQNNSEHAFVPFSQSDSLEFLLYMLDTLSTFLSYKVNIEITIKDNNNLTKEDKKKLDFFTFLKKNMKTFSFIEEQIVGYFKTTILCSNKECNYVYNQFEKFLSLQLPIYNLHTLQECIKDFVKPIILDENNKWYCEKCKKKVNAEKKISLFQTSKYLIISYKRYKQNGNKIVKDDRLIDSPINLNLSEFIENGENNIYDLVNICIHNGNMNNGHYVLYRKIKNKWIVCNDKSIKPIEENKIKNNIAYYLIYQKKI